MKRTQQTKQGLYIMLVSIHGLIRGKELELGRDADTGGQTLYVVELAKALAAQPNVARVDLLTRRVHDAKVSADYSRSEEKLARNAYLVRIDCGPKRYLRKEVLWPHLDEFIDHILRHVRAVGRVPDVIHAHYADAGLVAARVAGLLGIPMIFTGHSLGKEKQRQLLRKGLTKQSIEKQYNIAQRIEAEEVSLGTAEMIVASTHQEVNEQYACYDNYHPKRMQVIPPGVNISRFRLPRSSDKKPEIYKTLSRFLQRPAKPMILAISRADERKNIATLVEAYGQSTELQKKANLVIVAGNRDDISHMEKGQREVLQKLLLQIDQYDLYGKVAYPKTHESRDVPELYRLAAASKGVFINPALTEPFGLTLIEAAASGLPIVATNDGGPKEIIAKCNNGYLVDPLSRKAITDALLKTLHNKTNWNKLSRAGYMGVHEHYSWPGHAKAYLSAVNKILDDYHFSQIAAGRKNRLATVDRLALTAIDNTLSGDKAALKRFVDLLQKQGDKFAFGLATGRTLDKVTQFIKRHKLPMPDVLITSVGTEIHYPGKQQRLVEDRNWRKQLDYRWQPQAIKKLMREVPGLKLQPREMQRHHKLSYLLNPKTAPSERKIKQLLRKNDLHAKVILSETTQLDILPIRASKGLAMRYLSLRWGIALDRILVVGDSGNDGEMLTGETLGVVVGNHSRELDKLKDKPRIYFAEGNYADGVMEGVDYYNFLGRIRITND